MGYFELKYEERVDWYGWLHQHRHEFICNVYDRLWYAVDNDLEKAKLFVISVKGRYTMKCNLEMSSLKRGSYLKIMLSHFEDEEDYEKCIKILELTDIIKKRY